ncbi:MAG TPA: hypothetical protein VF158_01410 [Longimicrobiales bacterium]
MARRQVQVPDRETRRLRVASSVVLAVWCAVGVEWFVRAMRGPAGFVLRRPPGAWAVAGMPLIGASGVTSVRRLLPADDDARRWLVVWPAEIDPFVKAYVQLQLLHLEYPRRIDVAAGSVPPALESYAGVIAPAGVVPPAGWRPVAAFDGYTRHQRSEP